MINFKPETLQVRWRFRTISSEKIVLDRDVSGKSEYDQCVGAALCCQSDNILMKENKKKNIFVQCDQILSEWALSIHIFMCGFAWYLFDFSSSVFHSLHLKWSQKVYFIRLLNNKLHGLSLSGGHHSLLFDQGFQKIVGRNWSERHLTVIRTPSDGTLYRWDCT